MNEQIKPWQYAMDHPHSMWKDPSKTAPPVGQRVICFYEKHGTYWTGWWNPDISCTRWRPL